MGLVAYLVAVPLIAAALLMLLRSEEQRRVITVVGAAATGAGAVAFAVRYLAGGHRAFSLPQVDELRDHARAHCGRHPSCAQSSCGTPCAIETASRSRSGSCRRLGFLYFASLTLPAGAHHMLEEPLLHRPALGDHGAHRRLGGLRDLRVRPRLHEGLPASRGRGGPRRRARWRPTGATSSPRSCFCSSPPCS